MATTTRKIAPRSAAETPSLDATDRELLALLQANARESVTTLGKKLGIARTTVIARMERLQKGGVITGYSVRLNQATLEKSLQAYVGLSVAPRAGRDVLKRLAKMPEIAGVQRQRRIRLRGVDPRGVTQRAGPIARRDWRDRRRQQDHHVGGAGGADQSGREASCSGAVP
jgi:DNA-binding Lrp family transcriptional regulator